jgi:hypothetical protein
MDVSPLLARRVTATLTFALALLAVACGGHPTTPTAAPPPASSTTSTSTTTTSIAALSWSVSGALTSLQTGTALRDVTVATPGPQAATTDVAGRYTLEGSNPTVTPYLLTFEHPGIVKREVFKTWQRAPQTLDATAIELRPPFSLEFYRQFVRGTKEDPSQPLRRWTVPPSIYLAATDGAGRPLPPSDVAMIRDTTRDAVRQLTGLTVAAFESGVEAREPKQDWIVIDIVRSDPEACGRSSVGLNPGHITFSYGLCRYAACGTATLIPETVAHEIGHAMGFYHHDAVGIMNPDRDRNCKNFRFSDQELFHAAIAYQRPPGNIEPDRDPRSAATTLAPLTIVDRPR